jgi:TRAP-type C4-dicarboxylate transport system permease small subunit
VELLLRWLEAPMRLMLWISLAAGLAMMLHVTVDVAGRTLFRHPFHGTTEIVSAYYMVAIAYLPWAWIARNDGHIVAEVFTRIGPRGFHFWLEIAAKLVTLVYVVVFAWQTYVRAVQQTARGEVFGAGAGFILVWPSRWILPLAAGSMAIYLVLRIARDVARETKA